MLHKLILTIKITQIYQMLQNPLYAILPTDQADLMLIVVIIIPLSYILSFIYNKYLFLTFTITFTIAFQSFLFKEQKWFLWGQQQIVYLLILIAPRKHVGLIVLIQSFTAMTVCHAYRLYTSYGQNQVDISAILMMQLFNYIGTAYNYQRGIENIQYLSPEQIGRRLIEKPNYITYIGYVNFLPACMVGPSFQFKDFDQYLHRVGDYKDIPNTVNAIIKQIGLFIFSFSLYLGLQYFQLLVVASPEFDTYNYFYKLFYIVMCITYIQLKYVVAWGLGMISMRASGITYNPSKNVLKQDGTIQHNFGKIQANGIKQFFLNPSIKIKVQNWNISTQVALKRYIYQNIYNPKRYTNEKQRKKRQSLGQFATVIVSAMWHGLYPGYYISFFHWILYIQITQEIFRLSKIEGTAVHNAYKNHAALVGIIQNLIATFVLTYFGGAFHLMTGSRILAYLKYTYCLPYFVLYFAFYLIVVRRILSPKRSKQRSEIVEKKDQTKKTQ